MAKVLQSLIPIVDQPVSTPMMLPVFFVPFILTDIVWFLYIFFSFSTFIVMWTILAMQVVEKTIRPSLVELGEDPDVDVRFFANQALQSIDHVMMSS